MGCTGSIACGTRRRGPGGADRTAKDGRTHTDSHTPAQCGTSVTFADTRGVRYARAARCGAEPTLDITSCDASAFISLAKCASVSAAHCRDLTLMCGCVRDCVRIPDCENVALAAVAKRVELINCRNVQAWLFCNEPPLLHNCTDVRLGCWVFGYRWLSELCVSVGLREWDNRWYAPIVTCEHATDGFDAPHKPLSETAFSEGAADADPAWPSGAAEMPVASAQTCHHWNCWKPMSVEEERGVRLGPFDAYISSDMRRRTQLTSPGDDGFAHACVLPLVYGTARFPRPPRPPSPPRMSAQSDIPLDSSGAHEDVFVLFSGVSSASVLALVAFVERFITGYSPVPQGAIPAIISHTCPFRHAGAQHACAFNKLAAKFAAAAPDPSEAGILTVSSDGPPLRPHSQLQQSCLPSTSHAEPEIADQPRSIGLLRPVAPSVHELGVAGAAHPSHGLRARWSSSEPANFPDRLTLGEMLSPNNHPLRRDSARAADPVDVHTAPKPALVAPPSPAVHAGGRPPAGSLPQSALLLTLPSALLAVRAQSAPMALQIPVPPSPAAGLFSIETPHGHSSPAPQFAPDAARAATTASARKPNSSPLRSSPAKTISVDRTLLPGVASEVKAKHCGASSAAAPKEDVDAWKYEVRIPKLVEARSWALTEADLSSILPDATGAWPSLPNDTQPPSRDITARASRLRSTLLGPLLRERAARAAPACSGGVSAPGEPKMHAPRDPTGLACAAWRSAPCIVLHLSGVLCNAAVAKAMEDRDISAQLPPSSCIWLCGTRARNAIDRAFSDRLV